MYSFKENLSGIWQLYIAENNACRSIASEISCENTLKNQNFLNICECVDDNYRGRGIAKEILIKLEEIAKEENVMFLQLTSSRFRTSARKLYSDLGFSLRESDIFRKVLE